MRGILGDNLGEGNCESKIASRQWGDNFCRETSICLAGPSGSAKGRRDSVSLATPVQDPRQTENLTSWPMQIAATAMAVRARALPNLLQTCLCDCYQGYGVCGKPFAKVMLGGTWMGSSCVGGFVTGLVKAPFTANWVFMSLTNIRSPNNFYHLFQRAH